MRRWLAPLVWISLFASGAFAQPATAGTAEVERALDGKGRATARVLYRARPGESNSVHVGLVPGSAGRVFEVQDEIAVSPGPSCTQADDPRTVRCELPPDTRARGPKLILGDRGDKYSTEIQDSAVFGGPGGDSLSSLGLIDGGPGNDGLEITGHGRNRILGGPGHDSLTGYGGRGVNRWLGGSGRDRIETFGGRNLVVPGRGRDYAWVDGRGVVRSRDGEIDHIECPQPRAVRLFIDGLDIPGGVETQPPCRRISRRGVARAVPISLTYFDDDLDEDDGLVVVVACPRDGPRSCAGSVTVKRRGRLVGKAGFQIGSGSSDNPYVSYMSVDRATALGSAEVILRTRDRHGIRRVVRVRFGVEVERLSAPSP